MGLKKSLSLGLALLFLAGCTGLKTRKDVRDKTPPSTQAPRTGSPIVSFPTSAEDDDFESSPVPDSGEATPIPVPQTVRIPKVGLIFGPGAARVYAQIGVLQEMQREKIPIVAVGGIEWGSVVAALYANKGLANEVEWQLSKLKAEDIVPRSFIGGRSGPVSVAAANDFMRSSLGSARVESSKLPFACAAHNLSRNQVVLMNRGSYSQLLPFCLAYPPVFQPWQGNISAMRDVKMLADHLRARGATTIVLVNVLGAPDPQRPVTGDVASAEAVLWNEISGFYAKPMAGVDHVLSIPLGRVSLTSFSDWRDIQQTGAEKGAPLVKQLARRLGL